MKLALGMNLARANKLGLEQIAVSILRTFGTDSHVYLPGVGMLSGIEAANYSDSARTTLTSVDAVVGGVTDGIGAIHATQATAANKPILRRGLFNRLHYSATLSNATWVKKLGVTVSGNVVSGATGTTWTEAVIVNAVASLASSTPYTVACMLKSSGATTATIYIRDQSTGSTSSSVLALTSTSQMVTVSRTTGAATTSMALMLGNSDGDVYVESTGLFVGTLTAEQILAEGGIPATTAAASNSSAGKYSWQFDGNDSLALGSVPFQMADDHCVIACVRIDSPAGNYGYALDFVSGTTAVLAALGNVNGILQFRYKNDAATVTAINVDAAYVQSTTVVVSVRKVASTVVARKNSVQTATATPSGVYTVTTARIGQSLIGGSPMSGRLGPVICIKGTVTDADLLILERWVASFTPTTATATTGQIGFTFIVGISALG